MNRIIRAGASRVATSRPFRALGIASHALMVCGALIGMPAGACAGTWLIETSTTLADDDLSHEGDDVIVRGATLTVNGAHSFNSLTIERNVINQPGVVTHEAEFSGGGVNGVWLTIAGDLSVQGADVALVGSRLHADARGFPSEMGPGAGESDNVGGGGAGHGGAGGFNKDHQGGGTYGSVSAPVDMGSGGGAKTGSATCFGPGGTGGGVIRLTVAGTLTIDGVISADGGDSISGAGGGGSGGSIWIEAGSLAGIGLITAHGGDSGGCLPAGGGGGAGRIAVHADASTVADTQIRAYGGNSNYWREDGGAGPVHYRATAAGPTMLIVDNGGVDGKVTEMTGEVTVDGLIVRNFGRLGPALADPSLHVFVTGDAIVTATGSIHASAHGFPHEMGPGVGGTTSSGGGGGGHGGAGGGGGSPMFASGGGVYGSFSMPLDMGSGGGDDTGVCGQDGGAGGGVIRMDVAGTLKVDGTINANGDDSNFSGPGGIGPGGHGGGGAGGSILIHAGSLTGSGFITANGGEGGFCFSGVSLKGGGGGGGRIAVYTCGSGINPSHVTALGSDQGFEDGENGTAFIFSDITITQQPQSVIAFPTQDVIFTVVTDREESLSYQWRFNGQALSDGGFVSGSQTAELSLADVSCDQGFGVYDVVVTDVCGFLISEPATLSIHKFADLDFTCTVDQFDMAILLGEWGNCPGACPADLDDNGIVNGFDLALLLGSWTP